MHSISQNERMRELFRKTRHNYQMKNEDIIDFLEEQIEQLLTDINSEVL